MQEDDLQTELDEFEEWLEFVLRDDEEDADYDVIAALQNPLPR